MVLTIAIGGCSCSGKTSVANELSSRLSNCSIIHQDHYYRRDVELPFFDESKALRNWDCVEAINFDEMLSDIERVKLNLFEQEKNSGKPSVLIIEGFLLFNGGKVFDKIFDMKYLLHLSFKDLAERRKSRLYPLQKDGEDIWEDPDGYVESVVYPLYLKYHDNIIAGNISDVKLIDSSSKDIKSISNVIWRELSTKLGI